MVGTFYKDMSAPSTVLIFDGASSHLELIKRNHWELNLCVYRVIRHMCYTHGQVSFSLIRIALGSRASTYRKQHPEKRLNKEEFLDVFTPVWGKCMTISNMQWL